MARGDGRRFNQLRRVEIVRGFTRNAAGSALIRAGDTHVLCTACWETGVPAWRKGSGKGWLTAEYDMLPGATSQRKARSRGKLDGRTQEIQRLVGRALRAVVDLDFLGENSILIDCDVLQADGGTRTASITGAYVALCDAVRVAMKNRWITSSPVRQAVAAVSVGMVHGKALLDLNYAEDVEADVDMNVVMTQAGGFVELQGTGEEATFSLTELDRLLKLARGGIRDLLEVQRRCLRSRTSHRQA